MCPRLQGTCPAGTSENKVGKCDPACPAGFKQCSHAALGQVFCATAAPLLGCDSCELLGAMYPKLDQHVQCQSPLKPPAPKNY